jgi:hypothetical protein
MSVREPNDATRTADQARKPEAGAPWSARGKTHTHTHTFLALRQADAVDEILKFRIAAERVESGIHPDPRHSSGALQETLLQGIQSF